MRTPLLLAAFSICIFSCRPTFVHIQEGGLPQFLSADNPELPLVSGHRGGRYYHGKPENSMAVFRYVIRNTPALLECDVQLSKDSFLVIMHDQTLDRTSTGSGQVIDHSLAELQSLRLKDDFGKVSRQKIPTLGKVLSWTKGKAILTLDVKRGVPWDMVIREVRKANAEDYVVLITYDAATALALHRMAPDLVLSVDMNSLEDIQAHLEGGIDESFCLAFTGTHIPEETLFQEIRSHNIPSMLGTMSGIDQAFEEIGAKAYTDVLNAGAQILATDHPIEAAAVVKEWRATSH